MMMTVKRALLVTACIAAVATSGCAGRPLTGEETDASDAARMLVGAGTPVPASGETIAVGTANADAADDPAIWVDPADSSRVVLFGTDKKAGLYAYDLSGAVLQNLPGGNPNNVDLRDGFMIDGRPQVLVAASDRSPERFGMPLYIMDPATLQTRLWGVVPVDLVEPYGLCLGKRGDDFIASINGTDGQVRNIRISVGADGKPAAVEEKRFALSSQTEGCVIDDETGDLYIGEEAKGVWRFSVDPANTARTQLATAPSAALAPDVEGVTLLNEGGKKWLIVSSQGDSAFAVWRVDGEVAYRGRFSVVPANGADAVTGTDGVAAMAGPVGRFSEGLVMMQDDVDEIPGAVGERQNFKLVDWKDVKAALKLE